MDPAARGRRGFLLLAAVATAGTALELALIGHWEEPVQLVPWAALLSLATALTAVWRHPGPRTARVARAIAVIVAVTGAIGAVVHVVSNYAVAPLNQDYSARWATMALGARWWAAITTSVGTAPFLAPAVLAHTSLALWLGVRDLAGDVQAEATPDNAPVTLP